MATTTPLSEIAVANMAANTLDERRLTSFNDATSFARFVQDEFGFLRDEYLATYPWAMAVEYADLPAVSNAPKFRWDYAYNLPADCLRVLELSENGDFNGAQIKYERKQRQIVTDCKAPLYVRYIKRLTDLTQWDPLPARAFGQYIALQAAHRITGKVNYVDKAERALERATFAAQQVDSLERGTPEDFHEADIINERGTWSY